MTITLPRHPGDVRLKRYADGECAPREAARISTHVARCAACAATLAFFRRVSAEASASAAPLPPEGMLERILAERAAGERVVLPSGDIATPARHRRVAVALLAAAAVVGVMLIARGRDDAPHASEDGWTTGLGLLPTPAYAEEVAAEERWPAPQVDGRRVRTGVWTYEFRVSERGRPLAAPERGEMRIDSARVRGVPAWRMWSAWFGHPTDLHETVEVERTTLRVLHRVADNVGFSRYHVDEWLDGDTLRGTMESRIRNRRVRVNRFEPPAGAPYLAGESSPLLWLQAVRLHPDFRARVSLLGWGAAADDGSYPIAFRVTGQGHARVGRRGWECW
ncbi:MAG TPA: zf-HC2 domain-containing protein, partial [Longimicrobiaceae bacterium]